MAIVIKILGLYSIHTERRLVRDNIHEVDEVLKEAVKEKSAKMRRD